MNKWIKLGISIAGAVIPGVSAVENVVRSLPMLKGQAKQDAVLALVKSSIFVAEGVTNKDLVNDPEVEKATRGVIDAVVALQNVVAKRAAAGA